MDLESENPYDNYQEINGNILILNYEAEELKNSKQRNDKSLRNKEEIKQYDDTNTGNKVRNKHTTGSVVVDTDNVDKDHNTMNWEHLFEGINTEIYQKEGTETKVEKMEKKSTFQRGYKRKKNTMEFPLRKDEAIQGISTLLPETKSAP